MNNFQRLNYTSNHENLAHSNQINYAQTLKENVVDNSGTNLEPQMHQFNYFLLLFNQLIKQYQATSSNIEKQRECVQQPQTQTNPDYLKLILEKYQEMVNNQQNIKIEPVQIQEQDGKKDKPFVPYKKRHFSMIDDTSSGSNQSSYNSTNAKSKTVKPKREVDPNQPKKSTT